MSRVRHSGTGTLFWMGLFMAAGLMQTAQADKTFTGSGNWSDGTLWTGGTKPVGGDVVIIDGDATNDEATAILASYTLNANRTNTFRGTNCWLRATNVVVDGVITHPINTNTGTPWVADNLVNIIAYSNVTIGSSGSINVDGKGYAGSVTAYAYGYGPGGGYGSANHGFGGGHGGVGAGAPGGQTYDSTNAPLQPGSGGGNCNGAGQPGGSGGGVVQIQVGGTLQVDGPITANGGSCGSFYGAGGGSGGSVYLTCGTLKGSGTVRADGGDGGTAGHSSGGGGGGRIAVIYSAANSVTINFSAKSGISYDDGALIGEWLSRGEVGTLYLSDTNFLPSTLAGNYFRLQIPGFTTWAPSSLTVTGAWVRLQDELTVNVAGDVVVGTNGTLAFGEHTALNVGGNLTVTNGGNLYVYSGVTNAIWTNSGSAVTVQGAMRVASNSVIHPASHPTSVGTPIFNVGSLTVAAGGTISAKALGYYSRVSGGGYGPGGGGAGGNEGAGAGHGGMGGNAKGSVLGGGAYGSESAPVTAGSGAGECNNYKWAQGGGAVRISTLNFGAVTVDGTITADGICETNYNGGDHNAFYAYGAGGGAGGSVYLECGRFSGSGVISARGGNGGNIGGWNGGGGGGRVAIWRQRDYWTGPALTTNAVVPGGLKGVGDATTMDGTNGTLVLGYLRLQTGTVIMLK